MLWHSSAGLMLYVSAGGWRLPQTLATETQLSFAINSQLQALHACDVCRRLEVAEAKHEQLLEEKRAMEADFKQVLSQYDIEFEDKGDQMAAQLHEGTTTAAEASR